MPMQTTPHKMSSHIRRLCHRLGIGWKPQYIPVQTRVDAGFRDCFNDVARHVAENGGRIVYGWMIWEWPRVIVEGEFHAVWESPSKVRIDVSKKDDGENRIFFVEDRVRTYSGRRIDNVRVAIGKDPRIAELISGNELFHRLFEERYGNVLGKVSLDPELANLRRQLGILAHELMLAYKH